MSIHVFKALVKSSQNPRKFFTLDKVSSPWRVESPCDRPKRIVEIKVMSHLVRQRRNSLLACKHPLALFLKSRCLSPDDFEGFR